MARDSGRLDASSSFAATFADRSARLSLANKPIGMCFRRISLVSRSNSRPRWSLLPITAPREYRNVLVIHPAVDRTYMYPRRTNSPGYAQCLPPVAHAKPRMAASIWNIPEHACTTRPRYIPRVPVSPRKISAKLMSLVEHLRHCTDGFPERVK